MICRGLNGEVVACLDVGNKVFNWDVGLQHVRGGNEKTSVRTGNRQDDRAFKRMYGITPSAYRRSGSVVGRDS